MYLIELTQPVKEKLPCDSEKSVIFRSLPFMHSVPQEDITQIREGEEDKTFSIPVAENLLRSSIVIRCCFLSFSINKTSAKNKDMQGIKSLLQRAFI